MTELPPNTALSLNYSLPPYSSLKYVGAVTNIRATDTFSTGWGINPEICDMAQNTSNPSVKICLKADSFENLIEIDKLSKEDNRKLYAKCVAQNLYNFMGSYSSDLSTVNSSNMSNYLIVPQDFLDKWLKKFEEKYKKDPNFILKTTE